MFSAKLPQIFTTIVILVFLTCLLTACTSQQEKSLSLAQQIINQITPPKGSQLLDVERISITEMGPLFGIAMLYGTQEDYFTQIEGYYRDLVAKNGWIESDHNADGSPTYCSPQYASVYLTFDERSLEDPRQLIPTSIPRETLQSYKTLYILRVWASPLDTIKCKRFDESE